MINLLTGKPGIGKTAHIVQLLQAEVGKRLIFVDGIKELKIAHEPVPHIDEWVRVIRRENGADDYEWIGFPPGSLIVIDECQRMFRPRHPSQKVPDVIAGFETHRHAGLDFWLLTQDATFLDSNVRKLLDFHHHVQESWIGSFMYTWPKEGDPKTKASLEVASRKKYKIPKAVFSLYKSAELHTSRKRPVPILVYVGALSLIAFVVLATMIVRSVMNKNQTINAADPAKAETSAGKRPVQFSQWRIVGLVESPAFRLVLSDGRRQRVVQPVSFKRQGSAIEANLEGGEVVTTWAVLDDRRGK